MAGGVTSIFNFSSRPILPHYAPSARFALPLRPFSLSPRPATLRLSLLMQDIRYRLPDNYLRGAGDTYFSGKVCNSPAIQAPI